MVSPAPLLQEPEALRVKISIEAKVRTSNLRPLNPADAEDRADLAGFEGVRLQAAKALLTRMNDSISFPMRLRESTPSALDEPLVFESLMADMKNRMLLGLQPTREIKALLEKEGHPTTDLEPIQVFSSEGLYYTQAFDMMISGTGSKAGLRVIEDGNIRWSPRIDDLSVKEYDNIIDLLEGKEYFQFDDKYYQAKASGGTAEEFLLKESELSNIIDGQIDFFDYDEMTLLENRELNAQRDRIRKIIRTFPSRLLNEKVTVVETTSEPEEVE